jgi:hypothetical protein
MCNTEHGIMIEFDGQFVCHGTSGVVCRSQNNGSAMLSKPGRELPMEIVAKHGMGKKLIELVI